jgi:hypothetical protein
MALYFSKTTKGFYTDAVHEPHQIPADAVVIAEARHQAMLEAQAQGHEIDADEQGAPVARPRAVNPEQQAANRKRQAQDLHDASDKVLLRSLEDGQPFPLAWVAYRKELRDVIAGASATIPATPDYPAAM